MPYFKLSAISAILIYFFSFFYVNAKAIDVVFVYDQSGSMIASDPQDLSRDAIAAFINLLPDGSRAGAVSYSHVITGALALTENLNEVLDFLDGIEISGYTDIPLGVSTGLSLLEEVSDLNNPLIVLFTDGMNNLPDGSVRTYEELLENKSEIIRRAVNMEAPIFVVGLNASGEVDANYLEEYARATGGEVFIINAAEDMLRAFLAVYSLQSGKRIYHSGWDSFFYVPARTRELSAIFLNFGEFDENALIDPFGVETEGRRATRGRFLIARINEPSEGVWETRGNLAALFLDFEPPVISVREHENNILLRLEFPMLQSALVEANLNYSPIFFEFNNNALEALLELESGFYELRLNIEHPAFFWSGAFDFEVIFNLIEQEESPPLEEASSYAQLILGGLFGLVLGSAAMLIIWLIENKRPKFFGSIVIEITDHARSEKTAPILVSLQDFGGRTTIGALLGERSGPVFSKILIQATKSRAIFVRSKGRGVIFTQDLLEWDGQRGAKIALGGEIIIDSLSERRVVKLRYRE